MRSTPQRNNFRTDFTALIFGSVQTLILRARAPEFRADTPFLRCPNRVAE